MDNTKITVVGLFSTTLDAKRAFAKLRETGFEDDQLGVVGRDNDVHSEVTGKPESNSGAIGAATGAGIGLMWGLGVAAGLIPAIGPVIAGGTFAALAASVATGAAAAGIAGVLVGWGVPAEDAARYENEVKKGRILVTVHTKAEFLDLAERTIRDSGGTVRVRAVLPTG